MKFQKLVLQSFTKFHKVSIRYEILLFEILGSLTMTLGGYERGNEHPNSGGISRVVDMTICLHNSIWYTKLFFGIRQLFLESNTFFGIQIGNRELLLESKMESEIESSKLSLESKTESVEIQNGIQAFFFESKLESNSKFLESKRNPSVLLGIQNIIHGYGIRCHIYDSGYEKRSKR